MRPCGQSGRAHRLTDVITLKIAVDSSPLDDVSVLERVAFVMARGDVYRA